MVLSVFSRFSYQLPSQLEVDFEQALSPRQPLPQKIRGELHKFLDNSSWTLSHRRTWIHREILQQHIPFLAKLYKVRTADETPLFQSVAEVTDFVLGVQAFWSSFQNRAFKWAVCPIDDHKLTPIEFNLEMTIREVDKISFDAFSRLAHLGYSKQELCSLVALEGTLKKVAMHLTKLPLHEAKVLSILGQLDYSQRVHPKTLFLVATRQHFMEFEPEYQLSTYETLHAHFNTRYRRVSSIDAFRGELALAEKTKPKLIIILAHGFQDKFLISRGQSISVNTEIPELAKLQPETILVLNSCSTGLGEGRQWSIANYFTSIAPQLRIFAPTQDVGGGLKLSPAGEPTFQSIENSTVLRHHCLYTTRVDFRQIDYASDPKRILESREKLIEAYKRKKIASIEIGSLRIACPTPRQAPILWLLTGGIEAGLFGCVCLMYYLKSR